MSSMFERYGGFATIRQVVMSFYDKVLESDITGPYFDNTDMSALIDHQMKFVAQVMGGPPAQSDEQLRCIHARFKIDNEAFGEVAMMMKTTLEESGVVAEDVDTIMQELASKSPLIIAA